MSASPKPRRGLGLRELSASPSMLERSPEVKTRAHTLTATAKARRERSRTRIPTPTPPPGVARASRRQRQIPVVVGGRCCLPVGRSGEEDDSESAAAI